jgi:hypothetical protein
MFGVRPDRFNHEVELAGAVDLARYAVGRVGPGEPDKHQRLSRYLAAQPAMEAIYRFKQRLCYLLLEKHHTQKKVP